jgi:selenide,water dikinase
MTMDTEIKLTQYSRGAGCGCKIAPGVLEDILRNDLVTPDNDKLLVGNSSSDDAAVYDMGNGTALISTTDFFMPIVDDAFHFGRIAAANAISDVYAMGGTPVLALAILGWPVDKIPASYAQKLMEGARDMCREASIPLAGGHSIDSAEPIFGLAVNGLVPVDCIKKNNEAKEDDLLFLTKPIGLGILSTAQKRGVLQQEHEVLMLQQMEKLNKVGKLMGAIKGVHAMTDITGFGLLGHLIEVAKGSGLSAELHYAKLQVLPGVMEYLSQRMIPDATYRNWNNYSKEVSFDSGVDVMSAFNLLPDPQTNGGLLIAVAPSAVDEVKDVLMQNGLDDFTEPIGQLVKKTDKTVMVKL